MDKKEYYKKVNKDKQEKLGISISTAQRRLMKQKLFQILKRIEENKCYRCEKLILSPEELSLEHILPWLSSNTPKETFFDLDNVTFSHLKCNCAEGAANYDKGKINSTTGYRGVSIRNARGTVSYTAQAHMKGKKIHVGYFKTAKQAAQAFDTYVSNLDGYDSKTNKDLGLL